MGDMETYLIVLVIVLLVAYLINRSQSRSNQGGESPHYDSPDVRGRGNFGRNRSSSESDATEPRSRRDDPNIQGRGSFGKDKD